MDDTSSACLGFVDFFTKPKGGTENTATTGSIRYLWYALGHRTVGQTLLDATESALKAARTQAPPATT